MQCIVAEFVSKFIYHAKFILLWLYMRDIKQPIYCIFMYICERKESYYEQQFY